MGMEVALEPAYTGVAGYFKGDLFLAPTQQNDGKEQSIISEMLVNGFHFLVLVKKLLL